MQNWIKILVLFSFLLSIVSSQEIKADYPEEVAVNEEFTLKLELQNFEDGEYDVKIDITENEKRIARVLSDGIWKSTFYYLKKAITSGREQDFTLKITQDFEKANIIIKIKNSKGAVFTFEGYEIRVKRAEEKSREEPEEEESVSFERFTFEESNETPEAETAMKNEVQVIKLDAKDIKNDNPIQEDKKETTIKKYAGAGLIILCIVLGVLIFLKSKKHGFEE